ncbi:hypothetical protein LTS14_006760 [Recurvomyces mirabilis]|uniref:uncharacterized protein n=1 Tax=Recurvomyces mirabilis TaxID=574656 RepID=UPI002DDDE1B5|nr:hypothetical protein LTS14_006760 [Recurvomyces mirabilis]
MGDIYRRAFEVLIWLGETDEMTTEAIKWLNFIDDLPLGQRSFDLLDERFGLDFMTRQAIIAPTAKRRWFERVWTLQEYALALRDPVLLCGKHMFAATQLARLVDEKLSDRGTTDDEPRAVEPPQSPGRTCVPQDFRDFSKDRKNVGRETTFIIRPRLYMRCAIRESIKLTGHISLAGVWSLSALTRTSIAHDYVYGLLGLMDQKHRSHTVVDYDLEPDDVYRQYMTQVISTCYGILANRFDNTTFQDPGSRHPSWVPDLSRQDGVSLLHGGRGASRNWSDHWRELATPPLLGDDGKILHLEGRILGTVRSTYLMPDQASHVPQSIAYMEDQVVSFACYSKSVRWLLGLWYGALDERHWQMLRDLSHPVHSLLFPGEQDCDAHEDSEDQKQTDDEHVVVCESLCKSVVAYTAHSSFITTTSDLPALSCRHAKVEDVLVYFHGFKGSFLVRPRRSHYAIVGWANVAAMESGQDVQHYCETYDVPEVTFRIG